MAEEKTYVFGQDGGSASVPAWLAAMNGNGGFGSFNSLADLFGFAIIASMFGWGNNGFGGGFGGGNAAGFLANQINNDSGRELIMNAVTSQGEASRTAIQGLATMLGQDFNLVNAGVQNVQNALSSLALQQAVSVPQIINAISSGDANIISTFQRCCCDQRQLTVEQGYQNQIRTLEQTNALSGQAERNTAAIRADIAAQGAAIKDEFCALKERELQSKIDTQADIITQLRGQIDNANQSNQIIGYINSVVAPLQSKVAEIANKMPNTVPVQYPNLVAVNNTPYTGGYGYGAGYGYGYGVPGGSYWG